MHDIFYHSKEYDFARKMIKELDTDLIEEISERMKEYPEEKIKELPLEDQQRIEDLHILQNQLKTIPIEKQRISNNLDLLTFTQLHDLGILIDRITNDTEFITLIFQSLTKKRELTNNGSGAIQFIIPRRTIAFEPNFSREELEKTLLNLQNARRNKPLTYNKNEKEWLLEYFIPDIEREGNQITIKACKSNDYSNNEYLLGVNNEREYDGAVYTYLSFEQLEELSEKLATFILKEKMKRWDKKEMLKQKEEKKA